MTKIFVGNLPFSANEADIRALFAQYGTVESLALITDRDTGRSRGFAFVEMESAEAADEAVRKFNGSTLGGRTLNVDIAKPSAPRGNGGDRRSGGGYRGGSGSRW